MLTTILRALPEGSVTTAYCLTHLATRFSYHLGQLTYHRRLLGH